MEPLESFVRVVVWSEVNLDALFCPLWEDGFEYIALEVGDGCNHIGLIVRSISSYGDEEIDWRLLRRLSVQYLDNLGMRAKGKERLDGTSAPISILSG